MKILLVSKGQVPIIAVFAVYVKHDESDAEQGLDDRTDDKAGSTGAPGRGANALTSERFAGQIALDSEVHTVV